MKKIITPLFLLTVFVFGFLPVKDTDFGWHYRYGNQFLTTGKLCLTNEFSYFLPNYKAYYSGHLYDIFLAVVYNNGGFTAVSFFGAFIFLSAAFVFIKLIRTDELLKTSTYLIVFLLSYPTFSIGLRPQVISYFFFLLLLNILHKQDSKLLFFLPLLFFIWTNVHIGFFIGLFVLLFYFFDKKISFTKYAIIAFLSFLATLMNPYGINVYKEIIHHVTSPLNNMIAEWVPPDLFHIAFIIFLTIVGIIRIIKKKSIPIYQVLLIVFFATLSLKARRNLPLFYVTFAYIFLDKITISLKKYSSVFISFLAAFCLLIAVLQIPKTILHTTNWNEYCEKSIAAEYPCEAIKNYPNLRGNVYSLYEWGGFLIWKKPNIKVFSDGRMPAWKDENGKSPYQVYLDIIQTKDKWNDKLRSLKTDFIFIADGTFLDLLLQKEQDKYHWREVYRDKIAVIYQNAIL